MRAPRRAKRRGPRSLRALWRAACGLVVAAAVLFGTVQSGGHYFYCDALGFLAYDPCVRADHQASPCPFQGLAQRVPDCCERITLPTVPDGAGARAAAVPVAAVAAVLSAAEYASGAPDTRGRPWVGRAGRWRTPPESGSTSRARLMVFLT